jgi:hypothetical protein
MITNPLAVWEGLLVSYALYLISDKDIKHNDIKHNDAVLCVRYALCFAVIFVVYIL